MYRGTATSCSNLKLSCRLTSKRVTSCKLANKISVRFAIPYRCQFGQHLRVIGGCERLGNWDLEKALPMSWNEGDLWTAELAFPSDVQMDIEYKYVVCGTSGNNLVTVWKPGGNFILKLPGKGSTAIQVKDAWDETNREIQIEMNSSDRKGRALKGRMRDAQHNNGDSAISTLASAAENALDQLRTAVSTSLGLMEECEDPASPELLAADRLVAAAAKRVTAMTQALNVARGPQNRPIV